MKKIVILSIVVSTLFFAAKANASGTVRCETQYGGGEVCTTSSDVQIDKKVCDITTKNCDPEANYYDNMTLSNHLFQVGEQVIFKLTVTNVSNETINKVTVTDYLPDYLYLNPNSSNNKLTYEITNLKPGASDTKRVDTLVSSDLPLGTTCKFNTARAVMEDNTYDEDKTQVCLGKGEPVVTVPEAGPVLWQLYLASSLLLAGSGIYLKKLAR